MTDPVAIILAAGKSKRMRSETPKVLHEACGRPIIEYVLDAARSAGAKRIILVIGHKAEQVQAALEHHPDVEFALQAEQLGTGHAVLCCREQLASGKREFPDHVSKDASQPILVLTGDTPLLRGESLATLVEELQTRPAACVVGTARTEQNEGLGRIVRDERGEFLRIVEQKDATPEEQRITEINTGCFAFDSEALFDALDQIRPDNAQGEYYLTDCAEILRKSGRRVTALCRFDISEAMGVNTQEQLAEVERVMSQRNR
jgi:bifunctional UDP-N-acetylglucosamine pyrophosphorylase / glucosamine-1-phosphate N-acetyltransferase